MFSSLTFQLAIIRDFWRRLLSESRLYTTRLFTLLERLSQILSLWFVLNFFANIDRRYRLSFRIFLSRTLISYFRFNLLLFLISWRGSGSLFLLGLLCFFNRFLLNIVLLFWLLFWLDLLRDVLWALRYWLWPILSWYFLILLLIWSTLILEPWLNRWLALLLLEWLSQISLLWFWFLYLFYLAILSIQLNLFSLFVIPRGNLIWKLLFTEGEFIRIFFKLLFNLGFGLSLKQLSSVRRIFFEILFFKLGTPLLIWAEGEVRFMRRVLFHLRLNFLLGFWNDFFNFVISVCFLPSFHYSETLK